MNTLRVFETERICVWFALMKNVDALQEDGE